MTKPYFSVVIPLYNKAPYISRAIYSILNQTYQNFEIIVVDDGSTDGGGEIVTKILDRRIKLLIQENHGASSARNNGIRESESDFIAFLDADDEWKHDHLLVFQQLINQYSECGFYAQSYEYANQGKIIVPSSVKRFPINWSGYLDNYLELAAEFPPFFSSSVCIKKGLLLKCGGFPEGVIIVEDISMWLKLFFKTRFAFCHSLNSIYHFGGTDNISLSQYIKFTYFEKLLEKYLLNSEIENSVKDDLYEYYTSRIFIIVSQSLFYGNQDYCRSLLNKCDKTKKFKIRWYRLYIFSFFPNLLYKLLFFLWKIIKKI